MPGCKADWHLPVRGLEVRDLPPKPQNKRPHVQSCSFRHYFPAEQRNRWCFRSWGAILRKLECPIFDFKWDRFRVFAVGTAGELARFPVGLFKFCTDWKKF